jgi:hypothetical protein
VLLICTHFQTLCLVLIKYVIANDSISQLGLQVLACSLLDSVAQKVQVITPKPPSTIVVLLKNAITAELKARGVLKSDEITTRRRDCLDRIMLSRVFDMDGLDEVLADLDATAAVAPESVEEEKQIIEEQPVEETAGVAEQPSLAAADDDAAAASGEEEKPQEASVVAEIQDSQDEDETPSPPPSPAAIPQPRQPQSADTENHGTTATSAAAAEPVNRPILNKQVDKNSSEKPPASSASTPDIILITHFSSLLTSFFTQRDKSAAHAALRLLATRLRRLSRMLPSNPLLIILNSTDSGAHASESHSHEHNLNMNSNPLLPSDQQSSSSTTYKSASSSTDPTLRSIFNPPHHASTSYKANKPTFGLVFTQLLDLHLLCTRAPRPSRAAPSSLRAMTVVEVLLDDIGLWEGERGQRRRREQRWTILASRNGRMISVPGSGRRELR